MSTSLSSRIARAFSTWPNSTAANKAVQQKEEVTSTWRPSVCVLLYPTHRADEYWFSSVSPFSSGPFSSGEVHGPAAPVMNLSSYLSAETLDIRIQGISSRTLLLYRVGMSYKGNRRRRGALWNNRHFPWQCPRLGPDCFYSCDWWSCSRDDEASLSYPSGSRFSNSN